MCGFYFLLPAQRQCQSFSNFVVLLGYLVALVAEVVLVVELVVQRQRQFLDALVVESSFWFCFFCVVELSLQMCSGPQAQD